MIAFGMAANIPGHSATEWGAVNVAFVCCVTECLWTYAYECVYLVFPVYSNPNPLQAITKTAQNLPYSMRNGNMNTRAYISVISHRRPATNVESSANTVLAEFESLPLSPLSSHVKSKRCMTVHITTFK